MNVFDELESFGERLEMIFATPEQQLENAKTIFGYFQPLIGQNGALAAVVNAFCESSLTPTAVGDHGAAHGLWQLHQDRAKLILAGTSQAGGSVDFLSTPAPSLSDQCYGIWWELQHSEHHALAMIKAALNSHDATEAWCQYYERPASKTEPLRRAGLAAAWATKLGISI